MGCDAFDCLHGLSLANGKPKLGVLRGVDVAQNAFWCQNIEEGGKCLHNLSKLTEDKDGDLHRLVTSEFGFSHKQLGSL